jgi:predicted O-methyltransferase YrrM
VLKFEVLWFKTISFIRFLLKSKNQHGIHSPFIFDLVINCFYKKTTKYKAQKFLNYKKNLLQSNQKIAVTDFGKGSKVFNSNLRSIGKIAKVAGISTKRALLLIRLMKYLKVDRVLELGTSLGLSAAAMQIGNPDAKIISLEGCTETSTIAKQNFKKFHFNKIKILVGEFNTTLPKALSKNKFDLIFIDGNHQKQATLIYFEQCLTAVHNDSVIIFDDIHWSKEMLAAWSKIKKHKKVTASIDTFQWGMVFFRREQVKEHFTIRI